MSSFLDRIQKNRENNIWLLKTKDNQGRRCYFYIQIDTLKKSLLENSIGREGLNITDYGSIIESGFGENPPEEIQEKMKQEYGFEE